MNTEELAEPTDHFSDETANLLKFHGMYQQDDRDLRPRVGDPAGKPKKTYMFMVRTGVPGGRLPYEWGRRVIMGVSPVRCKFLMGKRLVGH